MTDRTASAATPYEASARPEIDAITSRPSAQVLVIGGGINGVGTFRDLALQGIDVVLVERGDWASGASAASSHMIHGGIRYLENGEFRLVKESVTERNGLLRIAPHYVKPLPTTIPIFTTFSGIASAPLRFLTHGKGKPKERGAALIKVGLAIYDSFSRDGGSVPAHRFVGHAASLKALPLINPRVKYTATYYDGSLVNPERLALDVLDEGLALRSSGGRGGAAAEAEAKSGGADARAANYLEAVGARAGAVVLRDRLTGEEFEFTADVVVNTTGPWTDLTNDVLGAQTRFMGGTKGSHIVVDNPALHEACGGRELFFEHSDGRIVLVYPLLGKVLIGTTDLEHSMADPIEVTDAEVEYFFRLVRDVFPTIEVDASQIVFRFVGVRPLPRHDDTAPGFVSRDYRIVESPIEQLPGTAVLSLVGGKWTTFRALAEHLADEVLARIGRQRRFTTAGLPIGGGVDFPATESGMVRWAAEHGLGIGEARARELLERYGTKAVRVIDAERASGGERLAALPGYSHAEIALLARSEHVAHLADVVLRRTSVAFQGLISGAGLRELAEVVGDALGWGEARREREIDEAAELLAGHHGVVLTREAMA